MALLLFDGFDLYGTSASLVVPKWSRQTNGSLTVSSSLTRFGAGGAAAFDARYFEHDLASATSHLIVGLAIWPSIDSPSNQVGLCSFWDAATQQCTFCLEANGSLSVRRGTRTGTVVAQSSAGVVAFSSTTKNYQYVELDVTIHNTTGAVTAYVEGGSVVTASSLNTRSSANNQATIVRLGDATSGGYTVYAEDFYLLDTTGSVNNAPLGDVRVYTLAPSAAGPSTQWTASSGSNYQRVNELPTPDEDGGYVVTHTAGALDLYEVTDLPTSVSAVYGVAVNARMRKDDVGTRQAAGTLRSNATDQDGATRTLTGSYLTYWDLHEKNPDGNVAWTPTTANAAKIGVKCIS